MILNKSLILYLWVLESKVQKTKRAQADLNRHSMVSSFYPKPSVLSWLYYGPIRT